MSEISVVEPAIVARVRLRARRRLAWIGQLRAGSAESRLSSEMMLTLADPPALRDAEAQFRRVDGDSARLEGEIARADAAAVVDDRLRLLIGEFRLTPQEVDFMSLLVATHSDPNWRDTFGELFGDRVEYATPWLAGRLFGWDPASFAAPSLAHWQLGAPLGGPSQLMSPGAAWAVDPAIAGWLLGAPLAEPVLEPWLRLAQAGSESAMTCLYPGALSAAVDFAIYAWDGSRRLPAELRLIAPDGAGRRVLAAQICAAVGSDLLVADAGLFTGLGLMEAFARGVRVARMARLLSTGIYWQHGDECEPKLWSLISGYVALTIHGLERPPGWQSAAAVVRTLILPPLDRASRLMLWTSLTDEPPPSQVHEWSLLPSEITAAAAVAGAGTAAVLEACQRSISGDGEELITIEPLPYEWADIVVPAGVLQHLKEFEDQARLRDAVFDEWGLSHLSAGSRGVAALFSGPSGTGKTMAAQVIARSLGMQLLRVDLAGVVNKYIGETEKRLKRVFDACERANVVLFFDEADALFGQRTQAKDAHDRYANIEIDYMLQRMERFNGIAILATNRRSDIDPAFSRRLRFMIEFVLPTAEDRTRLWRLALPSTSPRGERLIDDIDFAVLGAELRMTGADIKSAALAAAFQARAEGALIAMRHVLAGARRQMAKHGQELRLDSLGSG
jgi:ATPase family associated with various cellular activities (AAA)